MLPTRQTKQIVNELLRKRPYKFGRAVGFTRLTELHNGWITAMLYGIDDETLQSHRGSYKTTCVAIALALNIIIRPNEKTAFLRKTDNDVKEVIEQVKKILLHDVTKEIVRRLWGVELKLTKATATEISTNLTNDPRGAAQLTGMGTGGSLTGKHFDRIFTDDIVNVQDRISKAEREHTKLIYQELQNIKNRGGRIFNTGTPWHDDDCFSLMPNPRKWDCYSTGLMSDDDIRYVADHMLPSLFAANYELKHIASEDIIFRDPRTGAETRLALNGFMQVDCAYDGEDYTAMTICHKTGDKYYIFGKMWRKHCLECENEIDRYYKQFLCTAVYNEKNADKGMYAQKLRARGMHVIGYDESQNKYMKIATYLLDEWENVYFCEGTDKAYIDQICEYNIEADHDDAPDSLASAVRVKWHKQSNYIPIWNK